MSITAVLDIGKTNVKVAVFEGSRILWQRSTPNQPLPAPPYRHEDADAIWAFFIAALTDAAREHSIDTLVATTHGGSMVLVGDDGLAAPVMDYEDVGIEACEPEYAPFRPPFSETYSPPLTGGLNYGRQIFYVETRLPEAFARTRHVLMYSQYFAWRLTGVACGELTGLGCHGDAWRPAEGRVSSLVERRGWQPLFPPIVKAYDVVGPLKPDIAAATGLDTNVRVLAGIHDSNASLLPHLLSIEPPFTVISTGTWVVIMAVGGSVDRLDPAKDMLCNVDATGRPLPTAKFMGGREFAAILDGASPVATADDLDAVIAAGALVLPSFAEASGPFAGRHGTIEGVLPDRPGARAALASLYAALVTDYQLEALGAERGPLSVEGSFASNELYCGILAALRPGQDVLLATDTAGTAYGASLLATWPKRPDRQPPGKADPLGEPLSLSRYKQRWRHAILNG